MSYKCLDQSLHRSGFRSWLRIIKKWAERSVEDEDLDFQHIEERENFKYEPWIRYWKRNATQIFKLIMTYCQLYCCVRLPLGLKYLSFRRHSPLVKRCQRRRLCFCVEVIFTCVFGTGAKLQTYGTHMLSYMYIQGGRLRTMKCSTQKRYWNKEINSALKRI